MSNKLRPHGPSSLAERAAELHRLGFTRGAIDILEVELRHSPEDGHLWQLRALLLHDAGRWSEALDNIERAQLLIPLHHQGQFVLADGLREAGRTALALDLYRQLAAAPDLPAELLQPLYHGFACLGAWHAAAVVCRRALKLYPEDDRICFALAQAMMELRQPTEIVTALLRRAVQLAPEAARYRVSLVLHLLAAGSDEEAYAELARVPVERLDAICCRCCVAKLLQLACDHGDAARATCLAWQLAQRGSEHSSATEGRR